VNPSSPYLDGAEAADFLGIKRETLYAYASRGLVRSEPGPKGRGRRYLREDLERLKARHDARSGHGPVAASALRWGEPVLASAITELTPQGPRYRGQLAVDLAAENAPIERVAALLWGEEPSALAWPKPKLEVSAAKLASMLEAPGSSAPLVGLQLAVPALAAMDPARFDAPVASELVRARSLLFRMAALAGVARDAASVRAAMAAQSVAEALLIALGVAEPEPGEVAAVDAALVLLADHELNASSFAVRVAASAGADLYACVCAGLATLSGPRHGGVCDRVEALVAEVGRPERAASVLVERSRRGEVVPGFGHTLYPEGDPRGTPLLTRATELAPEARAVKVLVAILEAMRGPGRPLPTVDAGLVAIAAALRLPPGSATAVFAIGRTVGWVAHAIEQREAGYLLRPRARYVGV
jgi:citrate synthase